MMDPSSTTLNPLILDRRAHIQVFINEIFWVHIAHLVLLLGGAARHMMGKIEVADKAAIFIRASIVISIVWTTHSKDTSIRSDYHGTPGIERRVFDTCA